METHKKDLIVILQQYVSYDQIQGTEYVGYNVRISEDTYSWQCYMSCDFIDRSEAFEYAKYLHNNYNTSDIIIE